MRTDWREDGEAANVYAQLEQLLPLLHNEDTNMSQFPTANDISQSKYMKKEDVGEDGCVCTIVSFEKANVGKEDDPEYKWTMHVAGEDVEGKPLKPLVINPTNWSAIERAYGRDASQWVGKKIVAYNDPNVSYAGKFTGGIRVRIARTGTAAARPKGDEDVNRALNAAADDEVPF